MRPSARLPVAILVMLLTATLLMTGASTVATSAEAGGDLTVTPTETEANPGERIPVTFSLNHSGTNVTAYIVDSDPPGGFGVENVSYQNYQKSGKKWLVLLEPDTSRELSFDLRVPANASGTYTMPFVVKSADGVEGQATLTIDTPGERTEKTTSSNATETSQEDGTQSEAATETSGPEETTSESTDSSLTTEASSPGFGILGALTSVGGLVYLLSRRLQ